MCRLPALHCAGKGEIDRVRTIESLYSSGYRALVYSCSSLRILEGLVHDGTDPPKHDGGANANRSVACTALWHLGEVR